MIEIGAAMMLSGTVQLLTPVPKIRNTQESQVAESRFFNSNQNTTAIGTRIAVAYGRNKIYGQLLSFNTQAVDRG
jgi:predicted phage tail protein